MEAGSLNGPPAPLERLVLCLIPPAARETVAGDLWELYRSPRQYAFDAARAIPFIVMSQVRRTANLPVLALQGMLLFLCFGGFAASPLLAALATAAILALFALFDAYAGSERPSARRAIIGAILAAGGVAEIFGLVAVHLLKPGWSAWPYFAFFGPYMVPVLCLVRTSVLVWSDRRQPGQARSPSVDEVIRGYGDFERRTARRNRIEIGVLIAVALALAGLPPSASALAPLVICAYLLAALYLLVDGKARPLPTAANFSNLRAHYRDELARQHRIRCLVWWLWFAPLFLEIYSSLIARGLSEAQPLSILAGIAIVLLFGFFIESLNRERRGRIHEEIGGLTAIPERQTL